MILSEVVAFIDGLTGVQREDNYGYIFYFVGDDHRLPFVTLANADSEYDHLSNLNREGVFRVNIGVSRGTFQRLVGEHLGETLDYTLLNSFLPHPDYAKQGFVCILSPSGENEAATRELIVEAHSIAATRWKRRTEE